MEPYLKNRASRAIRIGGTIGTLIVLPLGVKIAGHHPADLHLESPPNQVALLDHSRVNITLTTSASSSASSVEPTKLIF